MASDVSKTNAVKSYIFDCESEPIPPGTKGYDKLPRGFEEQTLPRRVWWLLGVTAVAALIVGAAVGRFLLS